MSSIKLESNASGTGIFTIASPNSNTNRTLTLPDSTGTVVVTGGAQTIEFAAGSASTPSITTTSDTNTGIFFPAADTIAFAEGGVESMRINSAGNVGIATTAPAAKLNVAGNTILSNVDMLNASYDSVSFSVAAQEITPSGLFFSPDGTRMYVTGSDGDDVNQYSLSTPWVVSSATFVTAFSIAGQETDPRGIFFRADGLKMYIVGRTNDTVYQYALTRPWTISTASYESISFSVTSQDTDPRGVFFKPDGLTMYITGITNDDVYQYALSTAWNVSTATFTQSFSVSGQETIPQDLSFTGDGSRMFIIGSSGDDVTVYNLTTPWDISTAATTGQFSVAGQEPNSEGIYVKPDGTKFYMVGTTNDTVYQYTIPSIEINLTGTTNINGGATVAQDLTVDGRLITRGSEVLVGKTDTSLSIAGITMYPNGIVDITRSGGACLGINRLTNDGTLVAFYQATTLEGDISVSGTTVSYNGGHLARWAQTLSAKDESLKKGTVLSNLDEMNVYTDAEGNPVDNEQLNKVKVSDVEGDVNVAGVFVNWTYDEAHQVDEINMAMTGDMIIRIAQGVVVQKGDLLMSAGDGTAKPQDDDIVRSKTVAKVTSNHVTCTYADGSYCVPCVLMAC
jgi:sugar lactone lactonase YvrE